MMVGMDSVLAPDMVAVRAIGNKTKQLDLGLMQ
jgi:hypothetical protein